MATQENYAKGDVAEIGTCIYEERIRPQVEIDENIGKLLMVDINTGAWVIGTDRLEMARRAREKNPDAVLFGMKIGYPATTAIGGHLRSYAEIARDQAADEAESLVSLPGSTVVG